MIRRLLLSLTPLFFLIGCAMPRIIILDDPLSPEEHLKLGMAYEKNGEFDLALREYKEASEEIPQARLFLGNIYFLQKDYASAEREYEQAIAVIPDNPRPYNNLAWLYYTQGNKLDEAEALARRAVELAPKGKDSAYRDTYERIVQAKRRDPSHPKTD